jgi:hypothetical protein
MRESRHTIITIGKQTDKSNVKAKAWGNMLRIMFIYVYILISSQVCCSQLLRLRLYIIITSSACSAMRTRSPASSVAAADDWPSSVFKHSNIQAFIGKGQPFEHSKARMDTSSREVRRKAGRGDGVYISQISSAGYPHFLFACIYTCTCM